MVGYERHGNRIGHRLEAGMKIALELSVEEAELLSSTAVRLGVRPEELARATIADALSQDKEEFRKAAEYVVEKNRVLYQRLA